MNLRFFLTKKKKIHLQLRKIAKYNQEKMKKKILSTRNNYY